MDRMTDRFPLDNDSVARGHAEADQGWIKTAASRLREDMPESFDIAWRRLYEQRKPGLMIAKVGSVAAGAVLVADGAYHIVAGADEEVDDLLLNKEMSRNYTRILAGAMEVLAGAAALYFGLTKGHIAGR